MNEETMTLSNLCGGAIEELFQRELERVLENIRDPNTKAQKARGISIGIDFAPDEERDSCAVVFCVKSKLQPPMAHKTQVYVLRAYGRLVAIENDPKQLQMRFDDEASETPPRVLSGGKED